MYLYYLWNIYIYIYVKMYIYIRERDMYIEKSWKKPGFSLLHIWKVPKSLQSRRLKIKLWKSCFLQTSPNSIAEATMPSGLGIPGFHRRWFWNHGQSWWPGVISLGFFLGKGMKWWNGCVLTCQTKILHEPHGHSMDARHWVPRESPYWKRIRSDREPWFTPWQFSAPTKQG